MYQIMIVEDDENIRKELRTLLTNSLYEVTLVDVFQEVAEQIFMTSPDLVLLDLNLPGEDGLRICSKVREKSDIPIIFVTGQNTTMEELNCITIGGDDFITKPYCAPILLARIAAVLKRSTKRSKASIPVILYRDVVLDIVAGTLSHEKKQVDLSKTEMKILHYLMEHKEQIVPRADLIDYLWDNQVYIDDNTLSVNMTRIRTKLEQIGVSDFIETKRGMGYKV